MERKGKYPDNILAVLLLTGYLGSGKTTLLNRILSNRQGIRFAVIVNDLGEVNIDAELIQKGGVVGQGEDKDLIALQNGCICCTLKGDLMKQISDLIEAARFDYIVIEASGICEPAPIAQTIEQMEYAVHPERTDIVRPHLDCIATVVDALRMKSEFGCGANLTEPEIDEEDIENLIIEQIEFCNIILLNKADEVSNAEKGEIKAVIRALQPKAEILECNYCDVNLDKLLYTHDFEFEATATSATWVKEIEGHHDDAHEQHEHDHEHEHDHDHQHEHPDGCVCEHCHHHHAEGEAEEYGISTFVYMRRRPFDFNKFDRFVNMEWPKTVIRAKGVLYFSHNRDMSILFEQAGMQKTIREAGQWYATAPEEELIEIMKAEPGLVRDWDAEYGDRMDKIVFIGKDMDKEAIAAALDRCLASPN